MLEGVRCPICTSKFTKCNVCALKCGHTFHFLCIEQWLKTSKSCPNCRTRINDRDVVKQLYFDTEADDSIATEQTIEDKLDIVQQELLQAKNNIAEMQQEKNKITNDKNLLQTKIQRVEHQLSKKETELRQLHETKILLQFHADETRVYKEECDKLRDIVKASEFYKLVVKSKGIDESMEAFKKYVNNGDIEAAQFLRILKSRNDNLRNVNKELEEQLKQERKKAEELRIKERSLQNLVTALTEECQELRDSNNKSTPYNPKLRPMLTKSPVKRISMGFDDSINLNMDVFESAIRKPVPKKPFRSVVTDEKKKIIVRDLDHFCELHDANAIPVVESIAEPTAMVDVGDGILMSRRTYESRNNPGPDIFVSPVKKAHIRMELENEERKNRKIVVGEPSNLKIRRTNSKNKLQAQVKPTAKKTARLSQFFTRRYGADEDPEVVQLD